MPFWALATGVVIAVPIALYGLHRFALWLEARGLLFYRNKQPTSTSTALMGLQSMVEPTVQHVVTVEEQNEFTDEDGDPNAPADREDAG